ncbi:MarR family transcriptional regulator [Natrinema soli]|uniref:MarR family transcriptional regulator n=1 Tax=Natrinema soli TaxID=1930624 RepID=A0ABD5SUG7_9EURY|nr:helix-turn-helix domain-containing protein [Natrinema soli]
MQEKRQTETISTSHDPPITYNMNSSTEASLEELPPSSKLVYKTLEYEYERTQKKLIEETKLVARTVRYALNRLEEEGLIEKQVSFQDARQQLYMVSE